jgi:hypothetical protein
MALARVVTFDGVSSQRMDEMREQMEGRGRPEGVPSSEILVFHDPEEEKAVVILFFETEDDYTQGDAALNAMPRDETPGKRSSVKRYVVAHRMTE